MNSQISIPPSSSALMGRARLRFSLRWRHGDVVSQSNPGAELLPSPSPCSLPSAAQLTPSLLPLHGPLCPSATACCCCCCSDSSGCPQEERIFAVAAVSAVCFASLLAAQVQGDAPKRLSPPRCCCAWQAPHTLAPLLVPLFSLPTTPSCPRLHLLELPLPFSRT